MKWIVWATGSAFFVAAAAMGHRTLSIERRIIARINRDKHWSEHQVFQLSEPFHTRWPRIVKAYRAVEPSAPLLKEFRRMVLAFLAAGGVAAVTFAWGLNALAAGGK